MNVIYVAVEMAPFSKVGGLADVAGALPQSLASLGHRVRVITPLHRRVGWVGPELKGLFGGLAIPFLGKVERATVKLSTLEEGLEVYFIDNETYFDRDAVYGEPDDLLRYSFFSQAALAFVEATGERPDILHCNDWHTAPLLRGIRTVANSASYADGATVLTIHNLAHQGPDPVTDYLGQGIYSADVVNTVSPTYAREILTPEYGEGLEHLLSFRHQQGRLFGILNGLDYQAWNPANDPHLAANFGPDSLQDRVANKAALQRRCAWEEKPERPLLGVVSRLVDQKGLDLMERALPGLLAETDIQIVVLGTGDERYHRSLRALQEAQPGKVAVFLEFNDPMARLIYGGSDLFLMPSRFEPCGLSQMIAMRYGALPVVRRTGGLADTVVDIDEKTDEGNGFVFNESSSAALSEALRRALGVFANPEGWRRHQRRAMAVDFSWEKAALEYLDMYHRALAWREALGAKARIEKAR